MNTAIEYWNLIAAAASKDNDLPLIVNPDKFLEQFGDEDFKWSHHGTFKPRAPKRKSDSPMICVACLSGTHQNCTGNCPCLCHQ